MSKQVRALIEEGLSGEEAAVILMRHYWERDNERKSFMSANDEFAIRSYLLNHASDYDLSRFNAWMETYRVIYLTLSECKAITSEICLYISDAMFEMMKMMFESSFHVVEDGKGRYIINESVVSEMVNEHIDFSAFLVEGRLADLLSAKQVIMLLADATGVPFIEWFENDFMPGIEGYVERFEHQVNWFDDKKFKVTWAAFIKRFNEMGVNQETVTYFEERFALNLGDDWKTYVAKLVQERAAGNGRWNKINSVLLSKNDLEALEVVHA